MTSTLIFFIYFGLTKCEDWCSVIAPDGNYRALGITHNWKSKVERDFELVMYNTFGYEWVFTFTDPTKSDATIQIKEGTLRPGPASDVINRFAMYFKGDITYELATNFRLINKV